MHELSIATSVVENLTRELANQPGQVVTVRLRIGVLSGVVPEALVFSWDLACHETRFEGSSLQIEEVPAQVWCNECESEQSLSGPIRLLCPVCKTPASEIVAGRELEIHSVEVSENEE